MSKVTPSQTVAAAVETAEAVDKRGRRITVRRLNALQLFRLAKVLGGATAANPAAADMATLACAVQKIDATPYDLPSTEREVEFLLQTLDFDGLNAAAEAMSKFGDTNDDDLAESAKN